MAGLPGYPGPPRWVKLAGLGASVLILLLVVLMAVGGRHGPWQHMSGERGSGQAHR